MDFLQQFKYNIKNNIFDKIIDDKLDEACFEKKFKDSIDEFRKNLEKDTKNHNSYFLRGCSLARIEDFEQSISDIIKAIKILEQQINEVQKRVDYKSNIKLSEDEITLLNYILNIGIIYEKAGDSKNAIDNFKKVIDKYPNEGSVYSYLGNSYLSRNKLEEAIHSWKKALEYNSFLKDDSFYLIKEVSKLCNKLYYPLVLIDNRDDKEYRVVKIGRLLWMAENLDYLIEGSVEYDVEQKTVLNKKSYGRYYNYEQALTSCPYGWRIPTKKDFENLIDNLGGNEIAGHKLLENEESGFDALLLGSSKANKNFSSAYFWIQDKIYENPQFFSVVDHGQLQFLRELKKNGTIESYQFHLAMYNASIIKLEFCQTNYAIKLNVRCVKDIEDIEFIDDDDLDYEIDDDYDF